MTQQPRDHAACTPWGRSQRRRHRGGRLRPLATAAVAVGLLTGLAAAVTGPPAGAQRAAATGTSALRAPGRNVTPSAPGAAVDRLAVVTPAIDCGALVGMDLTAMTGVPVSIASAAPTTATPGKWPACEVTGNLAPQIQFQALLPTGSWRQLYLQTGCGGFCGSVGIQAPASQGCLPLTQGQFVMASDNQGHYGTAAFDATFGASQQLRADWGYRSEHVLAVFMKQLIRVYYGKPAAYSFYDGCSEGGHEGLTEAQQYPRDFNGIVAGAPANITQPLDVFYQGWNALANMGPDGKPVLTADKLPALHAAVVKACGGPNGLVMNPLTCTFDPASIECPPGTDAASCLTPAQVTTVDKLYGGPRDRKGQLLYPGWLLKGSELNWATWIVPSAPGGFTIDPTIALNTIRYLAYRGIHPHLTLQDIQFTDANFHKVMADTAATFDATNPNLRPFRDAGGKLIMWQGLADPAISPVGTIAYYQAVEDTMGGPAATAQFARLFMLPGVSHCGGGQGPSSMDALDAVVAWVEQGTPPTSLLTTQTPTAQSPVASLPVYPYPLVATYNGTGNPDVATSYHAALPPEAFDAHIPWAGTFTPAPPQHRG